MSKTCGLNAYTYKSDKQTGDMIILAEPCDHVAVISSVNPNRITQGNLQGNNAMAVENSSTYWFGAQTDSRGNHISYYPDKNHLNRWNVLNISPAPLQPLKMKPFTGISK